MIWKVLFFNRVVKVLSLFGKRQKQEGKIFKDKRSTVVYLLLVDRVNKETRKFPAARPARPILSTYKTNMVWPKKWFYDSFHLGIKGNPSVACGSGG